MDCSICSSMPFILRPPRNTICGACYEGAKNIISLMNKLEVENRVPEKAGASPNPCKPQPLANVTKWMTSTKEMEEELNKKIKFLSGFVCTFKEGLHADILLKPGNDGTPIPAHRALLASRSEIFRNILDSDRCKAPPEDTITIPDLTSEELESLLEFLYSGNLSTEKLQRHVYSLFVAADKYDIPYLHEFCERHMLSSLNALNALDILSISDMCSNKALKDTALGFIVRNMEDIVFSQKYEAFAPKNPNLCVQITRAFLVDAKNRRSSGPLQ